MKPELERSRTRARSVTLDERLAAWRALPLRTHVGSILLLLVASLLVWWRTNLFSGTLTDELAYLRGSRRIAAGESPFGGGSGYLYPSVVAHLCALLADRFGEVAMLYIVRLTNLLGLATTLWIATAWMRSGPGLRLATAFGILLLSPMIHFSVELGNLSLLVSGLLWLGLVTYRRRSIGAGVLFGLSTAIKPIAPAAVACLALQRPATRSRRGIVTASTAVAIALPLYLALPYLTEFLRVASNLPIGRSVSPHRFLALSGSSLHPAFLSATLGAIAIWVLRRRDRGETEVACLATAVALATTPVVWAHTLVASLPLQTAAAGVAIDRWRAAAPRRRLEAAFVGFAVLALQASRGAGGIDDQAILFQLIAVALPALAPAALTAYVATFCSRPEHA